MDEFSKILAKYEAAYVSTHLHSAGDINRFAATFYKDVAEIYDCITRARNTERNPAGFGLNEAPILGLLVRVWKLLKEVIRYYEADNAEMIAVMERPLIEAAVTAEYLLRNGDAAVEDYRKLSCKDRLRLLRQLREGSPFFGTKAGQRLLRSMREKMAFEGLTESDFEAQKKNRWRLQGKTFFDIFAEVIHEDLYASSYGMMSESVHGSWNESLDYSLRKNNDGTFLAWPFFQPADIRFVTPTIRFCNPAYRSWVERAGLAESGLLKTLDWIDRVNAALYRRFDDLYDGA
jgi:hypothetical protein